MQTAYSTASAYLTRKEKKKRKKTCRKEKKRGKRKKGEIENYKSQRKSKLKKKNRKSQSDKSGPGNDSNEGILRIPQSYSITGTPQSDCHILDTRWRGILLFIREAVDLLYSPKSTLAGYLLRKPCL